MLRGCFAVYNALEKVDIEIKAAVWAQSQRHEDREIDLLLMRCEDPVHDLFLVQI